MALSSVRVSVDVDQCWVFLRPRPVDLATPDTEDVADDGICDGGNVSSVSSSDGMVLVEGAPRKIPFTAQFEEVSKGDRVAVWWRDQGKKGKTTSGWSAATVVDRVERNSLRRRQRGVYRCTVLYDAVEDDDEEEPETEADRTFEHTLGPEEYLTSNTVQGKPKQWTWIKLRDLPAVEEEVTANVDQDDMPLDVRGEDNMPVDGDSATVRTASGGLTDIDHGEAESHTENPLLQTADVMKL